MKPNQIRLAREMIGIAMLCRMAVRVFGLDFILAPFGTDVFRTRWTMAQARRFLIVGWSDVLSDLGPGEPVARAVIGDRSGGSLATNGRFRYHR